MIQKGFISESFSDLTDGLRILQYAFKLQRNFLLQGRPFSGKCVFFFIDLIPVLFWTQCEEPKMQADLVLPSWGFYSIKKVSRSCLQGIWLQIYQGDLKKVCTS